MIPASEPRAFRDAMRLLVVDGLARGFSDWRVADLPHLIPPGDLLVVNDAATLPASLPARAPSGNACEIRLLRYLGGSEWKAVVFGEGDWRTPTELRDPPDRLPAGTTLTIGADCSVEVLNVDPESHCLLTIGFASAPAQMWTAIYASGSPIQYSYLNRPLDLWSIQIPYASRPWAVEMPSAGYCLTWRILLELKRRGVGIARLTHAAGLSATGDKDLDARLPLPESFDLPQSTIDAINATRVRQGRVIAVGTTVVRALEGCAEQHGGRLVAGAGETDLRIGRHFRRRIVDGILTGVHDPAQSHFRLLSAFEDDRTLRQAWRHASRNRLPHSRVRGRQLDSRWYPRRGTSAEIGAGLLRGPSARRLPSTKHHLPFSIRGDTTSRGLRGLSAYALP